MSRKNRRRLTKGQKSARHKRQESKRSTNNNKNNEYFQGNSTITEKRIKVPSQLSLKWDYAVPMLRFIKKLKKMASKHNRFFLDLREVDYIGEGGIAMFLSVISDLQRRGVYCRGTKPTNVKIKDALEKSGFFKQMTTKINPKNRVTKNDILTTGTSLTPQQVVVPQIHQAMKTVWKQGGRCPVLFCSIGEMMRNSIDHAFSDQQNTIWHLGVSHFEEENLVKFSFVDNGEGIIGNYRKEDNNAFDAFLNFFTNNSDVLKNAFEDGIESSTGLPWRGTGLPTIYEMYQDGHVKKFVVITNKCYLDFEKNFFKEMDVSFEGTYYYWEIDTTCLKNLF